MSSKSNLLLKLLNGLLEEAYIIADENKLYDIRPKVFKSHEDGFKRDDDNFGNYVRYSSNPKVYSTWISSVETALLEHNLQDAKFRFKINHHDPSKESNLPVQKFSRAIRELEAIIQDENYRTTYVGTSRLPKITFQKGTLTQGHASHKFNIQYANLISFLWEHREIRDSKNTVSKPSKPQTYSMIESKTGIKHDLYANIAKALSKLERDKSIHIQFKYPRNTKNAYLVVREN